MNQVKVILRKRQNKLIDFKLLKDYKTYTNYRNKLNQNNQNNEK